MLSVRSVRDPKKMKEWIAKYSPWQQPVVVNSYAGDLEGFFACMSLVDGLLTPESPGTLKVSGAGCGREPTPSGELAINGIRLHMGSPVSYPVVLEGARLLEILRGDGGLGTFGDIGGSGDRDGPRDHIDIIIGVNPAFSLERMQEEQYRIKIERQTNPKKP